MSTGRGMNRGTDTARGREGRLHWRKSAAVAVPAVLAVGAMAVVMAELTAGGPAGEVTASSLVIDGGWAPGAGPGRSGAGRWSSRAGPSCRRSRPTGRRRPPDSPDGAHPRRPRGVRARRHVP